MSEDQIRKDFEERMVDGGLSQRALERNSNGDYILMQADRAWEVWKAAHTHYAKSAAPAEDGEQLATGGQPQADAQDAERYRWLRDQGSLADGSRHPQSWRCVAMLADMGGEHADTAIDAAIAAAKEK